ncbi:MAG: hypothetical protein EAY66_06165 [Sphingobacteriales bacterium]|nr:MAG: hypothetical protein EAY66_06165 [Sphingobacteriales bacterium]
MNKLLSIVAYASVFCLACSPKTSPSSSTKIEALTVEGRILEKNTKINTLNLDVEKLRLEMAALTRDIKNATDDASKSAIKASEATADMKNKIGDLGKAATADITAEAAAKDARKVYKLNNKLSKMKDDEQDIIKQIANLSKEIEVLKAENPNIAKP